jgi:hypothetical protein
MLQITLRLPYLLFEFAIRHPPIVTPSNIN